MSEASTAAQAVNQLSDRFWDGILELSPISATLLGYEQGMDRLDDPGPDGRAKAHALHTATLSAADAIEAHAAATGGLPTEERITLDTMRVICGIELEQQSQRIDRLKVVDQMDGPQTMLPLLAAFQPTETPEQFETFLARLADYPRYMAANAELVREGLAGGLTAARIVTERVISQMERLLAIPDEQSPSRDRVPDSHAGRPRTPCPGDRQVRPPRRSELPGSAARRVPGGFAPRTRPLLGAQRRCDLQDADPGVDLARHRRRASCTGSGWRSSQVSRTSAASSPATWASATTRWPPARPFARRPAPHPPRWRSFWNASAARSAGRWMPLPATSARCPSRHARSGRSRSSRKRTLRRPTTTRRRWTAAGRASTSSTPTTCPAAATWGSRA